MKVFEDTHTTIYNKSCTDMSELEDNSIQCVVTSPPYWGLRKYDGNQDIPEWGCSFGLEKTPELYVAHSIEILREIKRVLRPDGVVFWNVGDSYFGGGHGYGSPITGKQATNTGTTNDDLRELHYKVQNAKHQTIKPKDLCLIPFRVAISAQEDGWYVRSVIIWSKNNPMPESVQDRPTDAYEHILMLTKSSRYYWDIEAVREPCLPESEERYKYNFNAFGGGLDTGLISRNNATAKLEYNTGRNLRNVWTFPTQPYPEAHFATFPEKLPETCIKAGTPEYGCCNRCGKPYERISEKEAFNRVRDNGIGSDVSTAGIYKHSAMCGSVETKTLGWQQACKCEKSKPVSSLILDTFAGSGTTLWVAKKLSRKAIGYELSEKYCELAIDRNRQSAMI